MGSTDGFFDLLDLRYNIRGRRMMASVEMSSSCENEIDIVISGVGRCFYFGCIYAA